MAGNTAVPGASLVGRVMAVLNCFGVGRTELTLTQIATRSGLPLSTVRRVTMELESGGYLERLVNKRYRVGIRLWEIGCTTCTRLPRRTSSSWSSRVMRPCASRRSLAPLPPPL
jgi:DNA-binding IclR family transcriptional regulator